MMGRGKIVVRGCLILAVAILGAWSCGSSTVMDAYVLRDGYLAGDAAKGIKPLRNLIIWPLTNNAQGSKAKGIEVKYSDIFVDKFYLEGDFDSVINISPDRANDLLSRAGEELGLKRKPKDIDGGLVASKIGQLVGGEAIFVGSITDFDEDKTDKATDSMVSGTFVLIDAREKAYTTLDSFSPLKYLWRTTVKQVSSETMFAGRASLDNTARAMVETVVDRMVGSLSGGQQTERRSLEKKIAELREKAADHLDKSEFDKAEAAWNDIGKLDPGNSDVKPALDDIKARKKVAEDRKKADALAKEIDALRKDAADLEKAGKLDEAVAKWTSVLEKDKGNKEAPGKIEKLKARQAEEKERAKQQEISKLQYQAQKSFDEKKYAEAAETAKKILDMDAGNEKAKAIQKDAQAKLDEAKALEKKAAEEKKQAEPAKEKSPAVEPAKSAPEEKPAAEPAKAVEKPAAPAEKPAAEPAKAVEKPAAPAKPAEKQANPAIDDIRKAAMGYFDKEEYQNSYDEWKKLLAIDPNDSQAKEMLSTTEMLIKALQ